MSQNIARRYAQALFADANAQQKVTAVDADVSLLLQTLNTSRPLTLFFLSPVVNREKKEAVIRKLLGDRVSVGFQNFLLLLVEKGREAMIHEVCDAYQQLRNIQQNIQVAETRVAVPLSNDEQAALKQELEKLTGMHIQLHVSTDESLIGGAVVRIGDIVYDGSVKTQLNALRDRLLKGSFLNN
ncbi:MAG: ATP synthase F1 subunit delta [Bacteroidetes Order II. Incertae sedis bacterium]|nr:ATP synthase F1 subunit delta [Bacteroidetes Order II. bacterium]